MSESLPRPLLRTLAVIAAFAASLSVVAWAARPSDGLRAPAAPVSVALVDLERIIDEKALAEYKDHIEAVRARGAALQANLDAVVTKAKDIEEQLKNGVPTSEVKRRQALIFEGLELETQIKAKRELYQRQIDLDRGDAIRDIYNKVLVTAEKVAKLEGYDLVLVDDRSITLPPTGTVAQYGELVQSRRILYANNALDITDRVLTNMNNDYTTGGGAKPNP